MAAILFGELLTFIWTFLHYVLPCCYLEAARRRFIIRRPIAHQLDNQISGELPESRSLLSVVNSILMHEFAGKQECVNYRD